LEELMIYPWKRSWTNPDISGPDIPKYSHNTIII
jgi:hypothetical protein